MSYTLTLDAASNALSTSLIAAVQAAYNSGGYPPLVITQSYVLSHAVRVGLAFWIPPQFWQSTYPKGLPVNLPTVAKITPSIVGAGNLAVDVPAEDVAYAGALITAMGGGMLVDVLGCGVCTGLGMLSGGAVQVGPWIAP